MNKALISVLLSFVLGGTLLAGLLLVRRGGDSCPSCALLAEELSTLQQGLTALREDTSSLLQEVRGIQGVPPARLAGPADEAPAVAQASKPVPAASPDAIKSSVLVALAEDREQREAKRQEEREEAKKRADQKRQELAALQQGPYDRFNVKVNSLAGVLQLTEAQKQAYYEVAKQARDKMRETVQKAMETAREGQGKGQGQGQPGEGGRGDRDLWGKMREVREAAQKEQEQALAAIFTPAQLETYNQLSRSARSFQDLGQVYPPGTEGDGESRRMSGVFGEGFGAAGGGGRGGGGGGGRGLGGPGGGGR